MTSHYLVAIEYMLFSPKKHVFTFINYLFISFHRTLKLVRFIVTSDTLDSTTTLAGNYDDLRRFSGQYVKKNPNVINGLHIIKDAFQHIRYRTPLY